MNESAPREIEIARAHDSISEPEWRSAVQSVPGLILGGPPVTITDPTSGEVFSAPVFPSDVQMKMSSGWVPVFRFAQGRARFIEVAGLNDAAHPVRRAAEALARRLGAEIRRVPVANGANEEEGPQ